MRTAFYDYVRGFGDEIEDIDEETFIVFTNASTSRNLGMLDPTAREIEITVAGRTFTIQQNPGVLHSRRETGTTGAVVWTITPLFAEWISSADNVLFENGILKAESVVVELGCGIAGIVGLALSAKVARYVLTDQQYVLKLVKQNVHANIDLQSYESAQPRKKVTNVRGKRASQRRVPEVMLLDWEESSLEQMPSLLTDVGESREIESTPDVVIACDCIYNEALIDPFVRTCTGLCELRMKAPKAPPTFCIVAQQLRSTDVFETWLREMAKKFYVWRIPQALLSAALGEASGFVVHVAVLR